MKIEEVITEKNEIENANPKGGATGGNCRGGSPWPPSFGQAQGPAPTKERNDRTRSESVNSEQNDDYKKPFHFDPPAPNWDKKKDWVLEIGPGNGKFITWIAAQYPQKIFIALELRNMRFQGVGEKAKKAKIENIIGVHGDARYCLPYLFEKNSLNEIYILFPDPWFKRRHLKNRLINPERVELFHSLLKKQGKVFFATDNHPYAEWVKTSFAEKNWNFEEGRSLYPTYFETKWKKMGRAIHYFVFQKR